LKQLHKRLTYANVMSSIAVFLVLGGATAFAATKIGANQLKANSVKTGKIAKEAVTTSKIKNNAINGAKVDEATLGEVPSAATAKTAGSANTATTASTATVGAPAAYALINANGTVEAGEPNRGISSAQVSNPQEGVYCIDLAFSPQTGSATPLAEGSEDTIVSIELGAPFDVCPDTAKVEARTLDAGEGAPEDENFWIQLDS
jgi:hypothetical protein